MRRLLTGLLASALLLAACRSMEFVILSNRSDGPITVRYSMPLHQPDPRSPPGCGFVPEERVRIGRTPPDDRWRKVKWERLTDYRLDTARCEIEYVVPAGFSAVVYVNGSCADDVARGEGHAPTALNYLSVEGAGHKAEWFGNDTAKPFKRARDGNCYYDFE